MMAVDWVLRHKVVTFLIGLAFVILLWLALVAYVDPQDPKGRLDVARVFAFAIQVFALIIAGIVGVIGARVGLSNLRIARDNLEHNRTALEQNLRVAQQNLEHNQEALREQLHNQRELEERRAQEDALQSYFEQMGGLLTTHSLVNTDREDIRQLAQ